MRRHERSPRGVVARGIPIAVALAATLALGACGSSGSSGSDDGGGGSTGGGEPFTIGINAPLTGPLAIYGREYENGAKMAVARINADGGVDGRDVELNIKDNKFRLPDTVRLSREMMRDDDAVIVGVTGTQFLAAMPLATAARRPLVSTSISTTPITQRGNPWVISTFPSNEVTAAAIVRYLTDEAGAKRIATIYDQSDMGVDGNEHTVEDVKGTDAELVVAESFQADDTDFSAQVARVKAADADALVIWGLSDQSVQIVRQARKSGFDGAIIGSTTAYYRDGFEKPLGELADGVLFFSNFFPTSSPAAEAFARDYAEEFGVEPNISAPSTYDAINLIADAFRAAGDDPRAVIDHMRGATMDGVTGQLRFDSATGASRSGQVYIGRWENGERALVATYDAAELVG